MKFGFLTINNKRPQIFHLFCASIKRLRKETGVDFITVCVSGAEDAVRCYQYDIHHITQQNNPATAKWDTGMSYLRQFNLDYVTIMGADDIMSTDTLQRLIDTMHQDIDLIGFNKIYVYATTGEYKGKLKLVTSRNILGVGKTINKRVLDKVDWRPWQGNVQRNWGMDALAHRNISAYVGTKVILDGLIVDCKCEESLNKFSMFVVNKHGVDVSSKVFDDILGDEEKQILRVANTGIDGYFARK